MSFKKKNRKINICLFKIKKGKSVYVFPKKGK